MPDAAAPVLEVDVAELRPRADVDFDGPAMQAGGRGVGAGRLGQHGRLGALFQHDQCMSEIDPARRKGRKHVQRPLDHHALGHIKHHSARPASGMQRRELIGVVIDRREQIGPQPIAELAHQLIQASEQHAPAGQFRIKTSLVRPTIKRACPARKLHAFAQKRLGHGLTVSRGPSEERELFQPEPSNVGPHPLFELPIGQRHLQKRRPSLSPQCDQPLRLPAIGQERLERLGSEPAIYGRCGHDRFFAQRDHRSRLQG